MAYSDNRQELTITRTGDVITIFPKRGGLKEAVDQLRRLPLLKSTFVHDRIELPDRDWD